MKWRYLSNDHKSSFRPAVEMLETREMLSATVLGIEYPQLTALPGPPSAPGLRGPEPALQEFVSYRGHLYSAEINYDSHMGGGNIIIWEDGIFRVVYSDKAVKDPSLAVWNNELYIAWAGTDGSHSVNVAIVPINTDTGSLYETSLASKTTLGYSTSGDVSIANVDNFLVLAFDGKGGKQPTVFLDYLSTAMPDGNNKTGWGPNAIPTFATVRAYSHGVPQLNLVAAGDELYLRAGWGYYQVNLSEETLVSLLSGATTGMGEPGQTGAVGNPPTILK